MAWKPRSSILAVVLVVGLIATVEGELTGGISSLGGVQMQEKEYALKAKQRGESFSCWKARAYIPWHSRPFELAV